VHLGNGVCPRAVTTPCVCQNRRCGGEGRLWEKYLGVVLNLSSFHFRLISMRLLILSTEIQDAAYVVKLPCHKMDVCLSE
jgi:hypothetical protein